MIRPETTQAAWVGWQPGFYLRLNGLWLDWVVRGGIWWRVRLRANAHGLTRPRILTLEPEHSETDRDVGINRGLCALKLLVISVAEDRSVLLSSTRSN